LDAREVRKGFHNVYLDAIAEPSGAPPSEQPDSEHLLLGILRLEDHAVAARLNES
jgi:hypothetical protein